MLSASRKALCGVRGPVGKRTPVQQVGEEGPQGGRRKGAVLGIRFDDPRVRDIITMEMIRSSEL